MALLMAPGKQAGELVRALGLPRETRWFELRVACGEVATLTACVFVQDSKTGEVSEVLRRFRLEEQETPNAEVQRTAAEDG